MRRLAIGCVLFLASPAAGFTLTQTSTGAATHWETPAVRIAIDPDLPSAALTADEVQAALFGAAQAWTGGLFDVAPAPDAAGATVRVRFHVADWPYATRALAYTRLTSNADTGAIKAAVIDVDERDHTFALGGQSGAYDLQAVLTHELGHALGLGHSADTRATMFATTAPGDLHQRTPDADDHAGESALAALLAPTMSAQTAGCSVVTGRSTPTRAVAMSLLVVGIVLLCRLARGSKS